MTCRDWFQLTLKEGLTVFRDQEFSGDMNSKAVNRIENVRALRARQFAEDAGPMSHPIRPESYVVSARPLLVWSLFAPLMVLRDYASHTLFPSLDSLR